MHETKRRQPQGDAVGHGERRDGPDHAFVATHEQQQRENEQQMIDTK